jgi:hypothetical protein
LLEWRHCKSAGAVIDNVQIVAVQLIHSSSITPCMGRNRP